MEFYLKEPIKRISGCLRDMYEIIVLADHTDPHPFITPKLAEIHSEVIAGSFDVDSKEKLTLQQDQKQYLGMKETPKKGQSKGCQCGKGKSVPRFDILDEKRYKISMLGSEFRRNSGRNSGSGPFSGIFGPGVAGIIF
jgi:hypothetical protein